LLLQRLCFVDDDVPDDEFSGVGRVWRAFKRFGYTLSTVTKISLLVRLSELCIYRWLFADVL